MILACLAGSLPASRAAPSVACQRMRCVSGGEYANARSSREQGPAAHRKRALALALRAVVGLHFALSVLEEGPQHVAALQAVEFDLLQLREHACAARHHSSGVHHLVQVLLPANNPILCHGPTGQTSCADLLSLDLRFRGRHLTGSCLRHNVLTLFAMLC